MWSEITSVGALVLAAGGFAVNMRTSKRTGDRDDFDSLRDELRKQLTDEREQRLALEQRIDVLEAELGRERIARQFAESEARALGVRVSDLERLLAVEQERTVLLQQRVTELEGELRAAGLPVPPTPHPIPPGAP